MGLFGKLFGGGDKNEGVDTPEALIQDVFDNIIELAQLDLSFDLEEVEGQRVQAFKANFFGSDEKLLTKRDGQLLDALQLFSKRALQHQFSDEPVNIICDAGDFRAKENQQLEGMIEKLKNKALDQGRSVYVKALAPKERRIVHQFISKDERVKSKSIGDGHYKKIKIFPVDQAK